MKKIIFFAVAILPTLIYAQGFVIKGKVGNLNSPVKVILLYNTLNGNRVEDSATFLNGRFSFKGQIQDPVKATLFIAYDSNSLSIKNYFHWDKLEFYIEKGTIEINSPDSIKHGVVKGGEMNAENKQLQDKLMTITNQINDFYASIGKVPDSIKRQQSWHDDMSKKEHSLLIIKKNTYLTYVKQNPQALLSLIALKQYAGAAPDLAKIQPLFDSLSPAVKESPRGKAFSVWLQNTAVGGTAPDFIQTDTLGSSVKLSSYRGKYVLLDFWASWCGPCRGENPYLLNAYKNFHNRNFDILGVSLDANREAWLKAVQTDHLTWAQLSDLKGWDNQAAKLYNINGIPQNFLIDPTGKIIARNLRGVELQKKLEEVLPVKKDDNN